MTRAQYLKLVTASSLRQADGRSTLIALANRCNVTASDLRILRVRAKQADLARSAGVKPITAHRQLQRLKKLRCVQEVDISGKVWLVLDPRFLNGQSGIQNEKAERLT